MTYAELPSDACAVVYSIIYEYVLLVAFAFQILASLYYLQQKCTNVVIGTIILSLLIFYRYVMSNCIISHIAACFCRTAEIMDNTLYL